VIINDEMNGIWKVAAVAYFKVLSHHCGGGTEWNHENNLGYPNTG